MVQVLSSALKKADVTKTWSWNQKNLLGEEMNFDYYIVESFHVRSYSMFSDPRSQSLSILFCTQILILVMSQAISLPSAIPILPELFQSYPVYESQLEYYFCSEVFFRCSVRSANHVAFFELLIITAFFFFFENTIVLPSAVHSQFKVWINPTLPTVLLIRFPSSTPRRWHQQELHHFVITFKFHLLLLMDTVKSSPLMLCS